MAQKQLTRVYDEVGLNAYPARVDYHEPYGKEALITRRKDMCVFPTEEFEVIPGV